MAETTAGLLRLQAALRDAARQPEATWGTAGRSGTTTPADAATLAYTEMARRQRYTDALLETIEVGIVACDAEGTFLVSNRAERAMFGLDGSLDGQPIDVLEPRVDVFEDGRRLSPEEYPLIRALRGEDAAHIEVLAGPTGGPYRMLVVRGRQITDAEGHVLGAVAALTDVTTERRAARELVEEHQQLAEAQRLGQLGSFEHDFTTGRWTFSEHVCALWGLDPARVTSDAIAAQIVPEDRRRWPSPGVPPARPA